MWPLYVRFGLTWEEAELFHLRHFLDRLANPIIQPLVVLEMPVRDLYGRHWSVTGEGTPSAETPDEAVFLPGRNVLLLGKAILWCHLHGVPSVAMAPLESNPFPDATDDFFRRYEAIVNQAIAGNVRIECPFGTMHKVDVLQRGHGLPLEWTFSCIRPTHGRHCGVCNKCGERKKGFADAGLPDPTSYERR